MQNARSLGVHFFERVPPCEYKMGLKKIFYRCAFFLFAILRFLPYKPEPGLTNLRGKITKGSAFKSDWMWKMGQYFATPYPFLEKKWGQFLNRCPNSTRRWEKHDFIVELWISYKIRDFPPPSGMRALIQKITTFFF